MFGHRPRLAAVAVALLAPLAGTLLAAPAPMSRTATTLADTTATPSHFRLVYSTDFSAPDPHHWRPTDAIDGRHHWIASQLTYGPQGLLIHVSQARRAAGDHTWYGGALNSTITMRYGKFSVTSSCSEGLTKCVALLWPDAKVWPPEVDFEELFGSSNPWRTNDQLTDHFGPDGDNHQIVKHAPGTYTALNTISVEWTPTSIRYLLNGVVVGSITNTISGSGAPTVPQIPMHLVINSNEQVDGSVVTPNHATVFRVTDVRIYAYTG